MEQENVSINTQLANEELLIRTDPAKLTGIACQGCEGPCESINAKRRRQNTAYVEESMNWVTLCDACMEWNSEYWREMWRDYYSDKL